MMSDDGFNMSLRKFLKKVGVTSQSEIEEAVRRNAGLLTDDMLSAGMSLNDDEPASEAG